MDITSLIAGKAKDVKKLLNKLLSNNPDITGALLLSYDGLVMVSTLKTGLFEDSISVMAEKINSSIMQFLKTLGWNALSNVLITGLKINKNKKTKEHILVKDIKGAGILVVLTKSNVDLERLQSHVDYLISSIFYIGYGHN